VFFLFSTVGCATHYVSPKDPAALIPDRSAEVLVDRMERPAVRHLLGEPCLSSTYWGFDMFRADAEQAEVLIALTPWPIPFARFKDRLHRYTLVTYDDNGRSTAVNTGLFRRPTRWRNVSPIESDYPSLHLRTGELMFAVDPEGSREVTLLATPSRRDLYLQQARTSTEATVVMGCGNRGCPDQLSVDAGPVRRLPLRTAHAYWFKPGQRDAWLQDSESPPDNNASMPWLETLAALTLSPGPHVLEFSAKYFRGRYTLQIECRPGEVTYLVVNASDNEKFIKRALVDWQIDQTETLPEGFARRPLTLLADGQWLVDAEPVGR